MNSVDKIIQYTYKGEIRTATLGTVRVPMEGVFYWVRFKKSRPAYLIKRDGTWWLNGTNVIDDSIERAELFMAIAKAIDEQL